jgi:hypothetical protein
VILEGNAGPRFNVPWAMHLKAVAAEEPFRLLRLLTGGILGCGGWVLGRAVTEGGTVRLVFEFERRACLDMYSVLIAAVAELSPVGHRRLTELCLCTRSRELSCGEEIASVEMEIQTYPAGTEELAG